MINNIKNEYCITNLEMECMFNNIYRKFYMSFLF